MPLKRNKLNLPIEKMRYAIIPFIYLASISVGQLVSYYLWRLRTVNSITQGATLNALRIYSMMRTRGKYACERVFRK